MAQRCIGIARNGERCILGGTHRLLIIIPARFKTTKKPVAPVTLICQELVCEGHMMSMSIQDYVRAGILTYDEHIAKANQAGFEINWSECIIKYIAADARLPEGNKVEPGAPITKRELLGVAPDVTYKTRVEQLVRQGKKIIV